MSNKNTESMDGVFNSSSTDQSAVAEAKPERPVKPKTALGRETKVGLGVIAALLTIFAVVLVIRFSGPKDDEVAKQPSPASEDANSGTSNAGDTKSSVSTGPTVIPAKSGSSTVQHYWDGTPSPNGGPSRVGTYDTAYSGGARNTPQSGPSQYSPNVDGISETGDRANHSWEDAGKTETAAGNELNANPTASQVGAARGQTHGSAPGTKTSDPFAGHRSPASSFDSMHGKNSIDDGAKEADATPTPSSAYGGLASDQESTGPAFGGGANLKGLSKSDEPPSIGKLSNPFERPRAGLADQADRRSGSMSGDTAQATADASGHKIIGQDETTTTDKMPGHLLPIDDVVLNPTPGGSGRSKATSKVDRQSEAPPYVPSLANDSLPASRGIGQTVTSAPIGKTEAEASNLSGVPDRNSSAGNAAKFVPPRKSAEPARLDESLSADSGPAAPRGNPGTASGAAYVVQANDTYWTIAQKTYGSGAYFKAVYEHNRRRLNDADRLQAGMKLSLPDEATLERLYPELCPKPRKSLASAARATRTSAELPTDGGTYLVEAGDTLYEIARRQLGKSSRWAEIYELNREVIGEVTDWLTPSTRLVLPAATGASPPKTRETTRDTDNRS